MEISWKDVLNPNHNWYGTIYKFFELAVVPSGYPYFEWNGIVFKVVNEDEKGFLLPSNKHTFIQTEYTYESIF